MADCDLGEAAGEPSFTLGVGLAHDGPVVDDFGRSDKPRATWFLAANLPGVTRPDDLELACRLVEAMHPQNTRAGSDRTYHLVISLYPEDRSLDRNELRRVVENLVETLGFTGHQYIAARHNDKEHVHVAIHKIHPQTFRIHSPAWDHQKLFTAGRGLELELGLTPLRSSSDRPTKLGRRARSVWPLWRGASLAWQRPRV